MSAVPRNLAPASAQRRRSSPKKLQNGSKPPHRTAEHRRRDRAVRIGMRQREARPARNRVSPAGPESRSWMRDSSREHWSRACRAVRVRPHRRRARGHRYRGWQERRRVRSGRALSGAPMDARADRTGRAWPLRPPRRRPVRRLGAASRRTADAGFPRRRTPLAGRNRVAPVAGASTPAARRPSRHPGRATASCRPSRLRVPAAEHGSAVSVGAYTGSREYARAQRRAHDAASRGVVR
jgi:hypothetical protein